MKPFPLREPPKNKYNGLTILLSNASRFDVKACKLLSATGGWFFENECLQPNTTRSCCDIRLIDCRAPFIDGTKFVLCLGQRALTEFTRSPVQLSEQRGSHLIINGLPCIASFLPQDAVDVLDYEKRFNADAEGYEEQSDEYDHAITADKAKGKTARSNYRFWLRSDTKKALRILKNPSLLDTAQPEYVIYPNAGEVIDILTNTKGGDLYFDIETDPVTTDMRCFAFAFDKKTVYVVPTLDLNYKPAYIRLSSIMRALAIAVRDNCLVAHYGIGFDYFLLAHKYGIGIGRSVYDTLVAQHRILPETELSLGHCISYWLYEPFHKNEGVHTYLTEQQALQLYKYCGKDVYKMILVKEAQLEHARKDPGLLASIQQAQASIRPYLITQLTGIRYNEEERRRTIDHNDRLMTQYMRIIQILTGPAVPPLISNQKCCYYFHTLLNYPVISKSQKTRAPSLAKENLFKLRLVHDNPVIDVLLAYRELKTETGKINFKPWRQ